MGYNNTPQVGRRASLARLQPGPAPRPARLPRSSSAYEARQLVGLAGTDEARPRSRVLETLSNCDDLLNARYRGKNIVELSNGVRQRLPHMEAEPGLRRRRPVPAPPEQEGNPEGAKSVEIGVTCWWREVWGAGSRVTGLLVMLLLAYHWSQYLSQLHENDLWFSEIQEVEREISFRTEQGLYYSYYKQLVEAPSLVEGIQDLKVDNNTEVPSTVNIIKR